MRKIFKQYEDSLRKIYGSLRKRFGLIYDKSFEFLDKYLETDKYNIIFVSSDDRYSREFINEVNSNDGIAYGLYKEYGAYSKTTELQEKIPNLIDNGEGKFIFISVDLKAKFRLNIPNTIFIKIGRSSGGMWIDVEVNYPIIDNLKISVPKIGELNELNHLIEKLYHNKWLYHPDIFEDNYKLSRLEFNNINTLINPMNVFICRVDDKLVGFVIYEYIYNDNLYGYKENNIISISDIYVDEEYRRRGIATRLYREVVDVVKKNRASKMNFRVYNDDFETSQFISSLHSKKLYSLYEMDV